MSTPTNPRRELPSTYIVQDRSNEEELMRLQLQDQMVTAGMSGVFAEQPDPGIFRHVLDVGCGTGGWLIEVARTYPQIAALVGIDVSNRMVTYAQAQAEAQGVSDRVQFRVMDALGMSDLPDNYFDLVNQRMGWSFLRTWDWPKILREYQRTARPGGVIRLTEAEVNESDSPALMRLNELLVQAMYQAGHFPSLDWRTVTPELPRLLKKLGLRDVQTHEYALEFRTGTPEGQLSYENIRHVFRTSLPFLRKWTRVPDDYEAIYQQALKEIQQPGFVATWRLLTAWGTKVKPALR